MTAVVVLSCAIYICFIVSFCSSRECVSRVISESFQEPTVYMSLCSIFNPKIYQNGILLIFFGL